jgi:hypothetical protein
MFNEKRKMASSGKDIPLPMLQRIVKQIEDSNSVLNATLLRILSKLEQIEQNQQVMINMTSKMNEDDETFINTDEIISSPTFANALKNIIKTKSQLKYASDLRTIYEAGFDDIEEEDDDK